PSRLELKRPDGSSSTAPLENVILTTFLYVSPVQSSPSWDHTGTPLHFHSSTTSGSACLINVRSRESTLPRQSPRSSIFSSIIRDGDGSFRDPLFFMVPSIIDALPDRKEPIMSPAPIRLLGIAGSLRRGSYNRAALRAATTLVPEGATLETF